MIAPGFPGLRIDYWIRTKLAAGTKLQGLQASESGELGESGDQDCDYGEEMIGSTTRFPFRDRGVVNHG